MSSKYPLTGVFDGKESHTSDYSVSGETAVQPYLQWKPQGHSTDIIGGVPNRCALELQPSSSTNQVDTKTSATYQNITPGQQADVSLTYEDVIILQKKNDAIIGHARPQTRLKCFVCVLVIVVILTFLVACGGIALASYGISKLETQLSNSKIVIEQLTSMLEDLQQNMSASVNLRNAEINEQLTSMLEDLRQNMSASVNLRNAEINRLSLQISDIHKSVDEITNSPNATVNETVKIVNISQSCSPAAAIETCSISQSNTSPVEGSDEDLPNFSACTTSGRIVDVAGTYIQDIYCAITNSRTERNPLITTLIYDNNNKSFSCYCYVTAFEERRGVVECGLFVRRCNDSVQV